MYKTIISLFLLASISLHAQKNIYESAKFNELSKSHKTLAILPFLTNLNLKDKITKEELKQLEEKEGYAVQNALETYFSNRKKKKKFSVAFQNIQDTKAILAKHNITYLNIDIYTITELSKILNVDGIISGNLDLTILLSKGIPSGFSIVDYFLGDANFGRIGMKISDGTTGKLLWKYEKRINKKSGKNTTVLIDRMMKLAIRKFPYEKERKREKRS
ncbi:hypothetical protein [Maribacter sp.]|uniref:hypothetical protein n=1 Tax=Maribacter sp. TaxID=1897614 RepID=UPI0025BA6857|nr:hypothetical protein [Maribacter sp.]